MNDLSEIHKDDAGLACSETTPTGLGMVIGVARIAAFIEDRIRRGYMSPDAAFRLDAAVRHQSAEVRMAMMKTDDIELSSQAGKLDISEVPLKVAKRFCNTYHRHLPSPIGHKRSFGCYIGGKLCAVAVVGRPVARMLDDGETLEITRIASTGVKNSVSMLIGAVRRYAKSAGATRIVTYTLDSESGHSLRASGMSVDRPSSGGGTWSRQKRRRNAPHEGGKKTRWVAHLEKGKATR